MIFVIHNRKEVIGIVDTISNEPISIKKEASIVRTLKDVAQKYPKRFLGWCHEDIYEYLNKEELSNLFHQNNSIISYTTSGSYIINNSIGYVDQSVFLNVNDKCKYPTWLMSSDVGGTSAELLNNIAEEPFSTNFDLFLCSLAKNLITQGVFCYSNPLLLKKGYKNLKHLYNNDILLYNFVNSFYKKTWLFLLFINLKIYDNKYSLISLLKGVFFNKKIKKINLKEKVSTKSSKLNLLKDDFTVDVLIPTLKRKKNIHDVLKDLANQTILPKKVIIVEQNPEIDSKSELDFLEKNWPFIIEHTFIHQLGACNARNIALEKVTNNWVFLADDDVRFEETMFEDSLKFINRLGADAFSISCLQKGEIEKRSHPLQWQVFASGASFVNSKFIKNIKFKNEHELGYGEDVDFGMQLRNIGCDILYANNIKMIHLKAPMGGFRFKHIKAWEKEKIQPKPSPTVMAYHIKHQTREQILGYKTILFTKFYKKQDIKNPITYTKAMKNRWRVSIKWAKKMMKNEV